MKESNRIATRQDIVYAMIDSDQSGLVVIDDTEKLILWNNAMETMTGLTQEEIQKNGIESIICDPEKAANHREGVRKSFVNPSEHKRVIIIHCDIKGKEGACIPVRVAVRMVDAPNNHQYAVARIDEENTITEIGKPSVSLHQ
jgi:PAS domain S-box-containing protein